MSRLTKAGGAKLRKAHEDDPAAQPTPADDGQAATAQAAPPTPATASENASISASENAGEKASGNASGNRARKKTPSSQRQKSRQPRRAGRPKGPDRVPLSVRILAETDARLTTAVEATGWNPQTIVDRALAQYLDTLKISADGMHGGSPGTP